MRAATQWHKCQDRHGRDVWYITSDECTVNAVGVCSILDNSSARPSYRLLADGAHRLIDPEEEGPCPARGLVVFGWSKFDRPALSQIRDMPEFDGAAVTAAIEADLAAGATP